MMVEFYNTTKKESTYYSTIDEWMDCQEKTLNLYKRFNIPYTISKIKIYKNHQFIMELWGI